MNATDRMQSGTASNASYTRTAIVLHWLIALGVFAQLVLGWWMIDIPKSPPGVRAYWFNIHKSIGITLGLLVIARIAWRLMHTPPGLPAAVPAWQRLAAKWNHGLLYLCMVVMPVSGYLGSNFTKYPIKYWGHALPHWGWEDAALKELMSQIHFGAVWLFMALIVLHVVAAVKHRALGHDGVFERMWGWPPAPERVPTEPLGASRS